MSPSYFLYPSRKLLVLFLTAVCLVCLPLGIWLYIANSALNEVSVDYTECRTAASATLSPPSSTTAPKAAASGVRQWKFEGGLCTLEFEVPTAIAAPVYMYVQITNMYQNHRYYVNSRSLKQLAGMKMDVGDLSDCGWLQYANCTAAADKSWIGFGTQGAQNVDCYGSPSSRSALINATAVDAQYYPCGLIANSMFLDGISNLTCVSPSTCSELGGFEFTERGIAWPQERDSYGRTAWATDASLSGSVPTKIIPPPQWRRALPGIFGAGYYTNVTDGVVTGSNIPDLGRWERYMVWSRKAGLPNFRKLWGKNESTSLPTAFDAKRFEGTKGLVFGQAGPTGSKGLFLGLAFLVVGGGAGFVALVALVYRPRKLADHALLSFEGKKRA